MWEAIKWVSSGLTLAAFIGACYLYFRVKSLDTDREIVKGTDDEKKLPILQALRNRTPLKFEKLDKKGTERIALQELDRLRQEDRRRFFLLLVGMVLMAGIIVIGMLQTTKAAEATQTLEVAKIEQAAKSEETAKPAEARLSVEYARLFGAVETPIVVQIQSHGGEPFCTDGICTFRNPMAEARATPASYEVQSGHFSPSIGKFWSTWPYKAALPVGTELWKSAASGGDFGFTLLNRAQDGLGLCVRGVLVPYEEDPSLKRSGRRVKCTLKDSKRVGFLFLVLKNISDREIRDLSLTYLKLPADTDVEKYKLTLDSDAQVLGAQKQTMAGLAPGQAAILLVSVYDKDENGFESKFLAEGIVPREVSFLFDGRKQAMSIRSPRREKALVAMLPDGWYLQ